MNYKKHYDLLIETRTNRPIDKDTYYEKHHVIPRSLGGSNDKSNIIRLTAREHFVAHWLLWRIHQNKQMAFAFYAMAHMREGPIKSSRIYEECKLARRKFIIENNKKYHTGKKISDEQKAITSKTHKNVKKSKQHRDKIAAALKDKPKSTEHKEKLSKALTGYDWSSYTERSAKISFANSGDKSSSAKKVYLYDLEDNLRQTFTMMKDARDFVNNLYNLDISMATFHRRVISKKPIGDIYVSY